MMQRVSLLLFLTCSTLLSSSETPSMRPDIASLVEAEKEFAKTSVSRGMREAFLAYLSEDSILFRPGPVPGKKWMEEHPARPGILTWEPIFADISKSSDMGYTTGPWEFRRQSFKEQPVAYGHYITIWKKPRFESWKVVLDVGISHPAHPAKERTLTVPEDQISRGKTLRKTDVGIEVESLLKMEDSLSKQISRKGIYAAYSALLIEDSRFYREDIFPIVGRAAIEDFLKKEEGSRNFLPEKAFVSGACDLGYSYGQYKSQKTKGDPEEPGHYVRIWKKNVKGQWRLALDIANPEPPKPAESNKTP